MFRLNDLPYYNEVFIQCHDNPDADTIASGFALLRYFENKGSSVRLIYGGFNKITKPNIDGFVRELSIPLEFVGKTYKSTDEITEDTSVLLITVDCQYTAGNVTRIDCPVTCVIDHHIKERDAAAYERIEPYLGSCATLVWKMLREADFDMQGDGDISTALYYGLYTDTNSFSELFHPMDRDLLDGLSFDKHFIKYLKGINLSKDELLIAGKALNNTTYNDDLKVAVYAAPPCDPNILGFTSDLVTQVDTVDVTIGYTEINGGVKLSLRSETADVMANELAAYLTKGCGSGGGNKEKAGGFLKVPDQDVSADSYLWSKINEYYSIYEKIVAKDFDFDSYSQGKMKKYRKKPLAVGYVCLEDIYPIGTEVYVRTLEGDASFIVSGGTYLMIGIQGETYPISREKFERSYDKLEGKYTIDKRLCGEDFYTPTVKDKLYEKPVDLMQYARACRPSGKTEIYAMPVKRSAKVFTKWYTDGYMLGKPNDYIAVRCDDLHDVYVIAAEIFPLTYDLIEE